MKSRPSFLASQSVFFKTAVLSIIVLLANACGDNCAQFDCVNGECEKGTCICDEGYEGTRCNASWSSKMVGNYEGQDCYDVENKRYTVSSRGADTFLFDNLFKVGISKSTELNIPAQEIEQEGSTFKVTGSGTYSNDTLWLEYFSDYGSFNTQCNLVLVKDN